MSFSVAKTIFTKNEHKSTQQRDLNDTHVSQVVETHENE